MYPVPNIIVQKYEVLGVASNVAELWKNSWNLVSIIRYQLGKWAPIQSLDFWEDWGGIPVLHFTTSISGKIPTGLWLQQRWIGWHNILQCCVAFNKLKKKVRIKRQKIGYFDFWPVLFCIKLIGERKHPHLWLWLQLRWYTSSVHCIKTFDVPHRKASENGTTRLPCLCWCSCRLGSWCSSGCGGPRFSLRWLRP